MGKEGEPYLFRLVSIGRKTWFHRLKYFPFQLWKDFCTNETLHATVNNSNLFLFCFQKAACNTIKETIIDFPLQIRNPPKTLLLHFKNILNRTLLSRPPSSSTMYYEHTIIRRMFVHYAFVSHKL